MSNRTILAIASFAGLLSFLWALLFMAPPQRRPGLSGMGFDPAEHEKVLAHWTSEIAADPYDLRLWGQLAQSIAQCPSQEEAVAAWVRRAPKSLLEDQCGEAFVWHWLGWMRQRRGDDAAAAEAWRRAQGMIESHIERLPERTTHFHLYALGWERLHLGDETGARAALSVAADKMINAPMRGAPPHGQSAGAFFTQLGGLAQAWQRLGDNEAAARAWIRVAEGLFERDEPLVNGPPWRQVADGLLDCGREPEAIATYLHAMTPDFEGRRSADDGRRVRFDLSRTALEVVHGAHEAPDAQSVRAMIGGRALGAPDGGGIFSLDSCVRHCGQLEALLDASDLTVFTAPRRRALGWAWAALGFEDRARDQWRRSLEDQRRVMRDKDEITVYDEYELICCLALNGEREEALDRIESIVAAGWARTDEARADPDLHAIRAEPRFIAALQGVDEIPLPARPPRAVRRQRN